MGRREGGRLSLALSPILRRLCAERAKENPPELDDAAPAAELNAYQEGLVW